MAPDQFEIVVVDNGSCDDTVAIAREYTEQVFAFPGVTVGRLRNEGAKRARGSVLAFIDADCTAAPQWLDGALAALADGGVAVGNKYDRPADARWIEALWLGDVPTGRHRTQELWAGNLVVGRDDFLACGGFDESLVSYEDVALSLALAKRGSLFLDDRVRVTHTGGPWSLAEFARQQLWHGFEEWTVFRRGIGRDTFAPTMLCIVGYILLVLALFALSAPTASRAIAFAVGAGLVLTATAWRLSRQTHLAPTRKWHTLLRLGVLNFVCLSAKAAAVVLRCFNLHWSGRRKTLTFDQDRQPASGASRH